MLYGEWTKCSEIWHVSYVSPYTSPVCEAAKSKNLTHPIVIHQFAHVLSSILIRKRQNLHQLRQTKLRNCYQYLKNHPNSGIFFLLFCYEDATENCLKSPLKTQNGLKHKKWIISASRNRRAKLSPFLESLLHGNF